MGRSKALILAAALAIGATTSALAADLLPPPPPMVEAAPPVPEYGGWYLRGDVGVGATQMSGWRSSMQPYNADGAVNTTVAAPAYSSLGDTANFSAGVGYQFNNWFRADLTGEYRTDANYRASQVYSFQTAPGVYAPLAGDGYFGKFGSTLFMANGYVDLGTWHGVTPFVGAGVGVAFNSLKNFEDGPALGFAHDTNPTNFAWAVMAGLGMNVTRNLKLELAYRYLDLGDIHSNPIICLQATGCGLEQHHFHVASHDVRLGFRYAFGGVDYAPAPEPMPMRRPLVSKY
jgi:opacity protein-like surface antigen